MVGELVAGLGAFAQMISIAKSIKDMSDATIRNAAVADLWEQILSAQARYAESVERISQLEKELSRFETWDAEKEKYELKVINHQSFAYAIKESARGFQPPHFICASCYEDRKKMILQRTDYAHLFCPNCKTLVECDSQDEDPTPTTERDDGSLAKSREGGW